MYNKIKNPVTQRWVNLNTNLGQSIVNNYIKNLELKGGSNKKFKTAIYTVMAANKFKRIKELEEDFSELPQHVINQNIYNFEALKKNIRNEDIYINDNGEAIFKPTIIENLNKISNIKKKGAIRKEQKIDTNSILEEKIRLVNNDFSEMTSKLFKHLNDIDKLVNNGYTIYNAEEGSQIYFNNHYYAGGPLIKNAKRLLFRLESKKKKINQIKNVSKKCLEDVNSDYDKLKSSGLDNLDKFITEVKNIVDKVTRLEKLVNKDMVILQKQIKDGKIYQNTITGSAVIDDLFSLIGSVGMIAYHFNENPDFQPNNFTGTLALVGVYNVLNILGRPIVGSGTYLYNMFKN